MDLEVLANSKLFVSLSSAIVAVIASYIVQRYMANYSYQNDYFKKIVDKRIHAYEALEECVHFLDSSYDLNTQDREIINVLTVMIRPSVFNEFLDKYNILTQNYTWYSKEIKQCLAQLEEERMKIGPFLEKELVLNGKDKDDTTKNFPIKIISYKEEATELSEQLIKCRNNLLEQTRIDWLRLYKVDTFLKEK